tara:strand:+ start:446 stop:994 length:549 start_codon:yes stop_codon:yes gene_type:complete
MKKNNKKKITKKAIVKKTKVKKTIDGSGIIFSTTRSKKTRKVQSAKVLKLKKELEEKIQIQKQIDNIKIRYSFHIESLDVNDLNIIEEIVYRYKGTRVIPKTLKGMIEPKTAEVTGVYIVSNNTDTFNSPVETTDYNTLSRKEIILFLSKSIRLEYQHSMRDIINKELVEKNKKINKLPWKS